MNTSQKGVHQVIVVQFIDNVLPQLKLVMRVLPPRVHINFAKRGKTVMHSACYVDVTLHNKMYSSNGIVNNVPSPLIM